MVKPGYQRQLRPATLPPLTIATGALGLDLAREQRRDRDRAGGLAGELGALVEEAEGLGDLLLADEHALERAAGLERERAGEGGVEAVGDRGRLDRDRPARRDAGVQRRARARARPRRTRHPRRRERGEHARDQAAAADRDDDRRRRRARPPRSRARPCRRRRARLVVEGMDERAPGLLASARRAARRRRRGRRPPGRRVAP